MIELLNTNGGIAVLGESKIAVTAPNGLPIEVCLYEYKTSGEYNLLIRELYNPGRSNRVVLDYSDVVAELLYLSIPSEPDIVIEQTNIKLNGYLTVRETEGERDSEYVTFRRASAPVGSMSEIKELRVPRNYLLPISASGNMSGSASLEISNLAGHVIEKLENLFPAGRISTVFHCIPNGAKSMRGTVVSRDGEKLMTSPIYHVCDGDFEQYLFANKHGGFDNIPMNGLREYAPEHSFETSLSSDNSRVLSSHSSIDRVYRQNSGYLSRDCIDVLSELFLSNQIYHWVDGDWKRIAVTRCDIVLRSSDHLHSVTFNYKYFNSNELI